MCTSHGRWPSSFAIKDGIKLQRLLPYNIGGHGEVYKALYNEKLVVVKTVKISRLQHGIDKGKVEKAKKVRLLTPLLLRI